MLKNFISPAPDGQIALVCCSPDNLHTTKYNKVDEFPTGFTLIIKPEEQLNVINNHSFEEAVSCGFNVLMYPGSDLDQKWIEYTLRALDFCNSLGVKLIVNSPILNFQYIEGDKEYKKDWPKSFVEQFVNHPALGGWMIKDEPKYEEWNDLFQSNLTPDKRNAVSGSITDLNNLPITSNIKPLIRNHKTISDLDNQHIIYMNLAVSYDSKWIGSHRDYGEYLDEYINTFNPPLLTFDHYPVTNNSGTDFEVNRVDFYYYLNLFSEKSKEYEIPFWAHCLCLKHDTGGANYPEPTLGMLRFEAFSALAFGAQGIVFWRYKQEYDVFNKIEAGGSISTRKVVCKELAPLNLYGERTPLWDILQQVISEIKGKNDYFYQCKCVDHIIANGSGSTTELTGYGNLAMLKAHTKGVLITRIETPDQNSKDQYGNPIIHKYMVVVNSDPLASQDFELLYQSSSSTSDNNIVGTTPGIDTGLHPFKDTDDGNYDGSSEWTRHTLIPGGCYIWPIV